MKAFFTKLAACMAIAAGMSPWANAQSPAFQHTTKTKTRPAAQATAIGTGIVNNHSAKTAPHAARANARHTRPDRAALLANLKAGRRTGPLGAAAMRSAAPAPGAGTAGITGNWTSATRFGSNTNGHFEGGQYIVTDASGNVYTCFYYQNSIVVGTTTYTSQGNADMMVLSYSPTGTLRWAKSFGGTQLDYSSGLSLAADGNLFLAGTSLGGISFGNGVSYSFTSGGSQGLSTVFVLKLNSTTGTPTWVKNVYSSNANGLIQTYDMATDNGGNPIIVGYAYDDVNVTGGSGSGGLKDAFALSLSGSSGVTAPRWFYRLAAQDSNAVFYGVTVSNTNRIYCTGPFAGTVNLDATQTTSALGLSGGILMQLDNSGDWTRAIRMDSDGEDAYLEVAMTAENKPMPVGYFSGQVFGLTDTPFDGGVDAIGTVFDTAFTQVTRYTFNGTGTEVWNDINVGSDGVAHGTGYFEGDVEFDVAQTSVGGTDVFVVNLNTASGDVTGYAQAGGANNDFGYYVAAGTSGALYVAGAFTDRIDFTSSLSLTARVTTQSGQQDAFFAKLGGSTGCSFNPSFSISSSGVACTGNTLTLSATGVPTGSGYHWSGPNGFSSTVASPQVTLDAGSGGTYSLFLTNVNNSTCSSAVQTTFVTITVRPTATVTPGTRCGTGSVTLSASGAVPGGGYSWYTQQSGGSAVASGQSSSYTTPSLSSSRTYYVSAGSLLTGCVSPRVPVEATISQPFTATISVSGPTTFCQGGSVTLTAQPDGQPAYLWSNNLTNRSIDVTASGTYTVTAGQLPGCTATSAPVQVTVTAAPNTAFSYTATQFCKGGTNPVATVTGTGGGSFRAFPAGLAINASSGLIDLAASQPGAYNITYRVGTAPCRDSSQRDVIIMPQPKATFGYGAPAYCQGPNTAQITLQTGSQSGTFSALPATGLALNANNGDINLTTSQAGTYRVYNTIAANGACPAARDSFFVTVNPTPVVTVVASPGTTACEGERVVLRATTSIPSSIVWTPAGTGDSVVATAAGTYQALATAGSCQGTSAQVVVSFTQRPAIPTLTPTPVGGGTILTASSTTPGVTYRWYLNGVPIPNFSAPQLPLFDPSQSGAYSVEAVLQGCSSPITTPILVVITGNRPAAMAGLKVYPNPVQGRLTIELPAAARTGQAHILSAEGRQVRPAATLAAGANRLDVSSLPRGLYLLKVVTADGATQQPIVVE